MNRVNRKGKIPDSWAEAKVGDLCMRIHYGYTASTTEVETGVRFLRITDISDDGVDWKNVPYCEIDVEEIEKYELSENDLVFARTGGTVGKSYLIKSDVPPKSVFASYLIRLQASKNINPKLLAYFFQSRDYWEFIEMNKTGLKTNVNAQILSNIPISVPSFSEQNRIVEKLDELLSELEKGKEQLQTSLELLKVYRQSVLTSAFEGKLTDDELNGRDFTKKWTSSQLKNVCHKIQDGSHFSPKVQFDSPGENRFMYITAKNIRNNYMDLSNVTYVTKDFHESIFSRCDPEFGDVLLTKDGVNTGDVTINTLREEFSLLSSVCLFKTKRNLLKSEFLKYYLQSPLGAKAIKESMTGTAIKRIILKKIREHRISYPTLEEQDKIVDKIESRFTACNNQENTIKAAIQQSDTLKQSILQTAFEGKLIEQNAGDERAIVLLERIKKEREGYLKAKKMQGESEKLIKIKNKKMAEELKRIMEILNESRKPVPAKTLWQSSVYKDDIDDFYAALKKHIEAGEIKEIRKGKESMLELVKK